MKVAGLLRDFFSHDEVAKTWFLAANANPVVQYSPSNGEVDQKLTVWLEWKKINTALGYELQFSTQSDLSTAPIIRLDSAADSFLTDSLEEGTRYFWRVRASTRDGETEWSPNWSFLTAKRLTQAPKLLYPENGKTFMYMPSSFCWDSLEFATSYRITFLPQFTYMKSTCYSPESKPDYYTQIYWTVFGKNALGESPASEEWKITFDPRYPPSLIYPKNGSTVTLPIVFQFSGGQAGGYFELATDTNMRNDLVRGDYNDTIRFLELGRKYYWRAVGVYGEIGPNLSTDVASFTVALTDAKGVATQSEGSVRVIQNSLGDLFLEMRTPNTDPIRVTGCDILGRKTSTVLNASGNGKWPLPAAMKNCILFRVTSNGTTRTMKAAISEH